MKSLQLTEYINSGALDATFLRLYGESAIVLQRRRYTELIGEFCKNYDKNGERELYLLSVAGRSELSGNHTDHNHGKVIAASIDLDIIAVAAKSECSVVRLKSAGFNENCVDTGEYLSPVESKYTSSDSLIAGMFASFRQKGYAVGAFDACTTSSVLKGSGLSSSAAFEDMVGNILNHLYNDGNISNIEIAKSAQYAENVFFGKPCGLMDQMACAVGGIIAIDFEDPSAPVIEKIDFDISAKGYNLCIVDTGGNHADLGEDYASIPTEMKSVAAFFGKEYVRQLSIDEIYGSLASLREAVGDRAILRALHFLGENERVDAQKAALLDGRLDDYFAGVIASGRSSFCYLQNVYTNKNVSEQGLSLAICLAEKYLSGKKGAFRVHGGGFAGTIQAYVAHSDVEGFRALMDSVFGEGACMVLSIRLDGAVRIL
ncbi:MAG: galactokinase [Clostridia bacterium]|nr:galactokinase [Clostridia bacterium]